MPTQLVAPMIILLAVVLGAGDQYLGSWSAQPWATDVSLLAAPWLILPFIVGSTQRTAQRAMWLATAATAGALVGYVLMTLSPIEHANVSVIGVFGLLRWQVRWFLLGAVTSPLFGWLGYRWRTQRALTAVLPVGAVLVLEPLARAAINQPIRSTLVICVEVAFGATVWALSVATRNRVLA
jgi:hypothetical protein